MLLERFTADINDDLNLPRALAVAWETLRGSLPDAAKRATLTRFDAVLGLGLPQWQPRADVVPPDIAALADARLAARNAKQWAESDRLRQELQDAGWDIEDRSGGYRLRRR